MLFHLPSNLCRVGVGFSYADYGETIETTEDAARNIHAFISIFFETFKEFSGRPIHLSGESYGVRHQVYGDDGDSDAVCSL